MGAGKNSRKEFYIPKVKEQNKVNAQTPEQITGVYVFLTIHLYIVKFHCIVADSET